MKSKIIPIILLMLVIFTFAMSTSVFAIENIDIFDGSVGEKQAFFSVQLTDNLKSFQYIYLFSEVRSNSDWFNVRVYITNDELIVTNRGNNQLNISFKDGESHYFYTYFGNGSYSYNFNNNNNYTCSINSSSFQSANTTIDNDLVACSYTNNKYSIFSNVDLKDRSGETVFYQAPLEEEQTSETLNTIITSMDFSTVLMEILGILPIVLVVVIGLLALRKAIQLLSTTLHQG